MISKSMKEELEARGYKNIDEDILKNLDKLDSNSRQEIEHVVVKEREKQEELNFISTKGMPVIVLDENKNSKEKQTLAKQIREGQEKDIYAFSKSYAQDKYQSMDEAYSYAKKRGLNVNKLKEAVTEVVEQRDSDFFTIKDIVEDAEFIKDEDEEKKEKLIEREEQEDYEITRS